MTLSDRSATGAHFLKAMDDLFLVVGQDLRVRDHRGKVATPANDSLTSPGSGTGRPVQAVLAAVLDTDATVRALEHLAQQQASPELDLPIKRNLRGLARHRGNRRRYDLILRAFVDDSGVSVLLRLTDVTPRWRAQRELITLRASHALLLGLLRLQAEQREQVSRLTATTTARLRLLLALPAGSTQALRDRLAHASQLVKAFTGEALRLELGSLADTMRPFSTWLGALQDTGTVRIADLPRLQQEFQTVDNALQDIAALATPPGGTEASNPVETDPDAHAEREADWPTDCITSLEHQLTCIAAEAGRHAGLAVRNLESVPQAQTHNLTWILVHLLHHVMEQDIESEAEREAAGKLDRARITIRCADHGARGVIITLRNDGRGVPPRDTDTGLFPLIVSLVSELGGGITQASKVDHYTQYNILLPRVA